MPPKGKRRIAPKTRRAPIEGYRKAVFQRFVTATATANGARLHPNRRAQVSAAARAMIQDAATRFSKGLFARLAVVATAADRKTVVERDMATVSAVTGMEALGWQTTAAAPAGGWEVQHAVWQLKVARDGQ